MIVRAAANKFMKNERFPRTVISARRITGLLRPLAPDERRADDPRASGEPGL
jgi:hypothetical protein